MEGVDVVVEIVAVMDKRLPLVGLGDRDLRYLRDLHQILSARLLTPRRRHG